MNVILELQRRQWRQVEDWGTTRLCQFAEERALFRLRDSWCCRCVVKGKESTLALAFSCDGKLLASSHLTHEILIHKTSPRLHLLRVLPAHPATSRTPWCLTFHPSHPHHLLSGCLGGSVLLWDVQAGECLCVWQSGISSPINSLVFLPTHPDHFLVACDARLHLMHHHNDHLETVWTSKTAALDIKVRLVLHHPDCNRILIAVTNHIQSHESNMNRVMRVRLQVASEGDPTLHTSERQTRGLTEGHHLRSFYRLQMYTYSFDRGPDLENSSTGLIPIAVRVLSPQSVVLTSQFVISSSLETAGTRLSIHSIKRTSFGQCLYSTLLVPKHRNAGVVSLELSACRRFLLLATSGGRFNYFGSCLKVFRVDEGIATLNLELCCDMRGGYSANVARWMPWGSGGMEVVCVGTDQGGVVWWGGAGGEWGRGEGETEDLTKYSLLKWFDK